MKTERHLRLEDDSTTVRAVLDSMGEGLITIDAEGIITAVNPYTTKALGYNEDELVGQWFPGIIKAVDQHRRPLDEMSRPIVSALTTGEAVSAPIHYLRKDGSLMPVFVTVSPILLDGRPRGAIELFRDITPDHQLDIAKEEFVSLASHQLRTPASGVRAILSMILKGDFGPLNDQQRVYLDKAAEANNRQLQVIEDILHTARIDTGKMQLQLAATSIGHLIKVTLSEQAAELTNRQQAVELELPEVPPIWIDGPKIQMVLDNLLSNASKYSPTGSKILVELQHTHEVVKITISDNGVGIAPQDVPRLFTKFSRIDNEFSTSVGGNGLGLYLAKSIVEMHQGSITVQSQPQQGTQFCVTLPINLGLST